MCGPQGSDSRVLASIQGSGYAFERQRCAAEAAKRAGVAGFSLAGLGMEPRQERAALMAATISELPANLPRFLLAGAGRNPHVARKSLLFITPGLSAIMHC